MKKLSLNFLNGLMLAFLLAGRSYSQALTSMPELSPVKMVILFLLDAYGLWKIIQCVKNAIDHLADSSKGDTTAKDRVWGSVLSIVGILMAGVILNVLIMKAGGIWGKTGKLGSFGELI